jgi:hypothetical protein
MKHGRLGNKLITCLALLGCVLAHFLTLLTSRAVKP